MFALRTISPGCAYVLSSVSIGGPAVSVNTAPSALPMRHHDEGTDRQGLARAGSSAASWSSTGFRPAGPVSVEPWASAVSLGAWHVPTEAIVVEVVASSRDDEACYVLYGARGSIACRGNIAGAALGPVQ